MSGPGFFLDRGNVRLLVNRRPAAGPPDWSARSMIGRKSLTFSVSLTTLAKLLAGAGFAPSVELVSTARPSTLLTAHREELLRLAERYRVRSIKVFGSVALGTDRPDSDLDLLVEFEPSVPGLARVDFAEAVEDLLGVKVDMINPASADPRFLRTIASQLRPLEHL